MTTTQILAENVTAGMRIIPTGRKQALEVLMADNHTNHNRFQYGCYGRGFTVHNAERGEYVTIAA